MIINTAVITIPRTHERTHARTHARTHTHTHTHTSKRQVRRQNLKSLVMVLFVEVSKALYLFELKRTTLMTNKMRRNGRRTGSG